MAENILGDLEEKYTSEIGVSCIDGLTGLYNYGFFQLCLEQQIAGHQQDAAAFSLALLDLDYFREYNQENGVLQGDRLLQDVARIIQDRLQKIGFSARLQKDLFAILHLHSTLQDTASLLKKISRDIETVTSGKITVSVGLSSYPEQAINKEELVQAADQQLHRSKTNINKISFLETCPERANSLNQQCILIVDDEERNAKLLEALLLPLGYKTLKANSGSDALKIVGRTDVDLILLDIMMPDINGYDVCRTLKNRENSRTIPIIMITALDDIEAKIEGIEAGADDFLTKPPNKIELQARTRSLLKTKQLNEKLTSIETVLQSLANVVEANDPYTEGHVYRVAHLAQELGKKLNLSDNEIESLKIGGILHDIGKIAIPKKILNKPGQLSADEWDLMKSHSNVGHKICLPLKKNLGPALKIIQEHHERLDGSGYPEGLKGEEISVVARVMAVVDIYDALITERPYRAALSCDQALLILREEAEAQRLDKKVVDVLEQMINCQAGNEQ